MSTAQHLLSLRRRLARQQEFRCFYCGCPIGYNLPAAEQHRSVTLEHYVPRSQGGRDNDEDCVASCRACDRAKGAMHGDDFLALLARVRKNR